MAGNDRLSALADDLLRRILYFVPFKEAASTSVLSRRWGSLWRSSGAVNLDVRIPHEERDDRSYREREEDMFSRRDAFIRAAHAALDAAAASHARVTRLTLRVEDPKGDNTYMFLHWNRRWCSKQEVIAGLVSHPAARRVEELRIAAVGGGSERASSNDEEPDSLASYEAGRTFKLGSLPLKALRVLDVTRCSELSPPAADTFPRLEALRLRHCSLKSSDIQALMDAAPGLATVHLESVFFEGFRAGSAAAAAEEVAPGVCLRCRAVTELVLDLCGMEGQDRRLGGGDRGSVEIHAPRLRHLRYKGTERRLSLTSPAPDMAVLELHFVQGFYHYQSRDYDPDKTRVLFWQSVRNFTNARVLKLRVNNLKDIAVGKARRAELLCTFRNAVRLELEGAHHPTATKAAAVAIANLLRCCPAVRDLRLKLSTVPSNSVKNYDYGPAFLERKDRLDYEKSVDRFMRRRLNPVISMNGNGEHDEVPDDIPGLSGHSLTCLQSSLRRVGLQFRLENNSSCFGTRLVKFFTGNAKVLQEIYVDSGNRKLCEHMNLNVERWIVPTSSKVCFKRKNLEESSWEFSENNPRESPNSRTDLNGFPTKFTVLPLER